MQWYYEAGNGQEGPVDEDALRAMMADGALAPENKVWNKDLPDWAPAGEVLGVAAEPEPEPEPEPETSDVDDAMAALRAAASTEPDSYDSYGSDDSYDEPQSYEEPASSGGALGALGGMLGGAASGASGQGGGNNPLGGLAGGLMSGLASMNGSEIRDAPIPDDPAALKKDFVQTLAKVGTFWSGGNNMEKQAAKDRLGALITTWRMSHTGEADYQATLDNFEAEVAKIAADAKKGMMILIGGFAAFFGFAALMALIGILSQ